MTVLLSLCASCEVGVADAAAAAMAPGVVAVLVGGRAPGMRSKAQREVKPVPAIKYVAAAAQSIDDRRHRQAARTGRAMAID